MNADRATLDLVVAGHTNTGKTSLLRTLGRTRGFGEVAATPSTTQHVQGLHLVDEPELSVTFHDTPGLERAGRLLDLVEAELQQRHDRPRVIRELSASSEAQTVFGQELMVLDQVLQSDACLVVIDAREPVLEKYLDEIDLLAQCGRPLLPLLNFVAHPASREADWRARLADLGQHLVVALDAAVYDWPSEARLYNSLAAVLPAAEQALNQLRERRARDTDWRLQTALGILATALIDLAACEDQAPADDADAVRARSSHVRGYAARRERSLASALLDAYNYDPDILGTDLHADFDDDGQWQRDLFAEGTARYYGVRAVGPVSAGAATGGTLDLLAGGTLLGAGTAIGALAGGAIGLRKGLRRAQRRWLSRQLLLGVPEPVLRLVATRNLQLIATLERRGHGGVGPVTRADEPTTPALSGTLPAPLRHAQHQPAWSDYRGGQRSPRQTLAREQAIDQLRVRLGRLLSDTSSQASQDQR